MSGCEARGEGPLRILLVVNTLPPSDLSGVGEQVLQLAAGLRSRGHDVEVLGRGRGGVRGSKLLFPLAVVAPVWRRVRRWRPHVVQVHESDGALAALTVAVLRALLDPAPRVVALLQVSYVRELLAVRPLRHDGRVLGRPSSSELWFRWLKAPLHVALGWLTAWAADRVLAPSRATAAELERDYGIDAVGVLPNVMGGRTIRRLSASDETPRDAAAFLFVGRLRLRKGVEVLLHAVSRLRAEGRKVRLRIAGDGEHRERLQDAVRRLGLVEVVEFLGRCDSGRVRQLLVGSRALVVPSLYEGMPLVILEAMEAGLPVIASRVSGIPEVVEPGVTGWLVPPEDPEALATALREALAAEPTELAAMGRRARARVAERYHPETAARRWEALLLGERHAAPAGEESRS